MADSKNDSTDESSIKPVSSLRSHFESIANSKLVSEISADNATPRQHSPSWGQRGSNSLERASIDVPRTPAASFVARDSTPSISQWGSQGSTDFKSRSQKAGSSLRRRPTSMSSLSSDSSHPTIVVNSPRSPPDAFIPPAKQTSYRPLPGRSLNSKRSRDHSPGGFHTLPVRTPDRTLAQSPNLYPSARESIARQDFYQGKSDDKGVYDDLRKNSLRSSTEHKEKPKVPKKPTPTKPSVTSIESGARRASNDISLCDNSSRENELSKSDSSMSQVDKDNTFISQRAIGGTRERSFYSSTDAPPRTEQAVQSQNSRNYMPIIKNMQRHDSPPSLFPIDSEGNRPGLPPRIETGNGSRELLVPVPKPRIERVRSEQNENPRNFRVETRVQNSTGYPGSLTSARVPISEFMPPPKRATTSIGHGIHMNSNHDNLSAESLISGSSRGIHKIFNDHELNLDSTKPVSEYPDISFVNRRPPYFDYGIQKIDTNYDTKLFDVSSRYVCTTGYLTKAWDLFSGELAMSLSHGEKEFRVTAMAFKPGRVAAEEGIDLWLGTNYGDLYEVDISTQSILHSKPAAHSRREIVKVFRCQESMGTLDSDGKLYVWPPDEAGTPNLRSIPIFRKMPRGHSFSLVIRDKLWLAIGREIRIFRPNAMKDEDFPVNKEPLIQPGVGDITSGAVIPCKPHLVYLGHSDGKVTAYSTANFNCLGVFNVSAYKINSMAGTGYDLWAGYSSGMISVYNTDVQPWSTKKEWQAHDNPVINILVQSEDLRVISIGTDNAIKLWDGLLEQDWLEIDMQKHDIDYCTFREIKARVLTWNAGASTPVDFRHNGKNTEFFQELLHVETSPEVLVFNFQELVDLEDKRLTAKSLFKANKRKDPSEHEHMSRQYRAWRDYLVRCVEDAMPSNEPYYLLHTASMVGLFSCVFVKSSEHNRIRNVCAGEIKRGMGGLHGNKGALVSRFVLDDSSLCFINCHLAAGQTQTVHRNTDIAAILDTSVLAPEQDPLARQDIFTGGGDGSMILDNEICILSGDLNYRIDTMGRDAVIRSIDSKNYARLLERDQLLVSRRRSPGFRLRAFVESPILFAPTYKYDLNSNRYDTSEKNRAPAWCDRILYRGSGNIKQIDYRRHELQISDHRPVSGMFVIRIKKILPDKRDEAWKACKSRFEVFRQKVLQCNNI